MRAAETTFPLVEVESMEDSLIARAKSGDDHGFELLMRRHERSVLSLCTRLLGSGGEAEEAAQDVFFRFYRALGRFNEDRAVEPWLFRIAWNTCRDRLRRRRPSVELTDGTATVPAEAGSRLVLAELRDAMNRLPDKERAALLLREVEGLETEEVAAQLGTSVVTVRSQISRARARLRGWLGGKA